MTWSSRALNLAACVTLPMALTAVASAAPLHQPLPAGSLEVNGTPQVLQTHHPLHHQPTTAVPAAPIDNGLHPHAAAGLKRVYSGTPIDVLTYHYDTLRTGSEPE